MDNTYVLLYLNPMMDNTYVLLYRTQLTRGRWSPEFQKYLLKRVMRGEKEGV
jgi:hypothetical protein